MSLPSSSAVAIASLRSVSLDAMPGPPLLELHPAVTGGRCLRTSWPPHSLPRAAAEVERRSRSGGRDAGSHSTGPSAAHPDTVQTRGSPQLQVAASCKRVSLCTACLSASSPEHPLMANATVGQKDTSSERYSVPLGQHTQDLQTRQECNRAWTEKSSCCFSSYQGEPETQI